MNRAVRLPAVGPKLRPIDRHVLDCLGDCARPVSAGDLAAKAGYDFTVAIAALERLVAMGYASRVDIGGLGFFRTYAANACPVCRRFVADLAHDCRCARRFPEPVYLPGLLFMLALVASVIAGIVAFLLGAP